MVIKKENHKIEDEFSFEMRDTPLERFEQGIVDFIGSWTFLILNIIGFALWMILDLPYQELTYWVSLEAIILSVLILINANEETRSDRSRAIKDYKIDVSIAKKLKGVDKELVAVKEKINKLLEKYNKS
jgi:uncharacterized membrane protein